MWIKICGMTTVEAVEAALAAGVDAIGFVFAPSSRQLTPRAASQLAAPARGRVRCIAVTRRPAQRAIDEIMSEFRPDVLQTDAEDFDLLRIPSGIERLPVLRAGRGELRSLPSRLLFEGPVSGSGRTCDWSAAHGMACRTELVLAGGLNVDNVASAIAGVAPFGVDVSSGVEERPGFKSPDKVLRFVERARSAFRDLAIRQGAPDQEDAR